MGLIDFNKPKKVLSTEEHNKKHSSDSEVAGTYVPNMSNEDARKWRGKNIGGANRRVEVRKQHGGANIVLKVYEERVELSANKTMTFNNEELEELVAVIEEAREVLEGGE